MSAKSEAEAQAAVLRRSGYPEAMAALEYCIEGEIGPDNFYTYTVCVYAGPYRPETTPDFLVRAMEKTRAKLST